MTHPPDLDPIPGAHLADPYPFYRALREADPVHWDARRRGWVLTRYVDVERALRDDAHFSAEQGQPNSMLVSDPPRHTRLRSLVSKAFTPRRVRALTPRIQQITDDLLGQATGRDAIDVIADFAYPLPITVIADLLGVDHDQRDFFRAETTTIAMAIGMSTDPYAGAKASAGRGKLIAYFDDLIARRRAEPRDDLVSALVQAEDEGDLLTHSELMAMLILLLVGGHETTVNLIGNGLLALLRHPDQLERLRREDGIERTATDELLRYDPPAQMTGRVAKADVELGGRTIRAGERVRMILAAANRDPDVFPDPDRLDVTRDPNHHLSFGFGVHYCLGAELARLEGAIAISSFVRRFPDMRLLADEVPWRPAPVLRGLEALPLAL